MSRESNNFLGIDFGRKKIGFAFAPEGILATGLLILLNNKKTFSRIEELIREYDIKIIVIGLPLNMNGTTSAATKNTFKFISEIKKRFPFQKIHIYDERMTSVEARKNIPSNLPDDAEAARIILQGFLDKQNLFRKQER